MQNAYAIEHAHSKTKRSPAHLKPHTLGHSRSRPHKGNNRHDSGDDLHMVNQSMAELQDPQFIATQIDSFETKLVIHRDPLGFCQVSRQKSILLSTTQGYRQYKKQAKASQQKQGHKSSDGVKHEEKQKGEQKKEEQSLCYSSKSQQQSKQILQKQSFVISNISSGSIGAQKIEQVGDASRGVPQKHKSF